MAGFSLPFAIATAVVTALILVAAADLLYVLWWRRRFCSETATSVAGSDALADPHSSPSKELLYFLCWKAHSRVDPAPGSASPLPPSPDPVSGAGLLELHGPSRFLCTIKEERETSDAEDPNDTKTDRKALHDYFSVSVVADEDGGLEETPFSTPCASPPFYTPHSSPPRGEGDAGNLSRSHEKEGGGDDVSGESSSCLVCVNID